MGLRNGREVDHRETRVSSSWQKAAKRAAAARRLEKWPPCPVNVVPKTSSLTSWIIAYGCRSPRRSTVRDFSIYPSGIQRPALYMLSLPVTKCATKERTAGQLLLL